MPTGVAQTPQQEEEEDDEDEELGEKFQFDDSEEEENKAAGNPENQHLGVSPAGAEPSQCPTGVVMTSNALYSQALKRVSASHCQGINGGTSAGQEYQTIPQHVTSPDMVARQSPDGSSVSAEPRVPEESKSTWKRNTIYEGKPETKDNAPSSTSEVNLAPASRLEVIYDDVPCETIPSPSAGDDTIYEDVQRPDESAGMLDNGWSSSEFESYDEQSDTEIKQPTRSKVQQLMKAARNGTKDGLEKTKIAMMRKVSFLNKKENTGTLGSAETELLEH
ncbi:hypothetical protein NFI96_007702 [Prochilodus magdalenae]|nr:hypothetical protein NFI96_007702 [Prochilodus magdalenae]